MVLGAGDEVAIGAYMRFNERGPAVASTTGFGIAVGNILGEIYFLEGDDTGHAGKVPEGVAQGMATLAVGLND